MSEWWKPSKVEDIEAKPWLNADATAYLEKLLEPGMRVLEHGCGGSTLWFAERVKSVLALDNDLDFAAAIRVRCPKNAKVMSFSVPLPKSVKAPFDLALIDGTPNEERTWFIEHAFELVKPGGIFILDNFNRPEYEKERKALEALCRHIDIRYAGGMYLNTEFFFIPEAK